ncbi:MAG TPA: hypothetical protein VFQ47_05665 [Nitrososphaera sp.]|jgi:hypothetical protein|nr:hypothetical protein [Nitrososphaera sp.]
MHTKVLVSAILIYLLFIGIACHRINQDGVIDAMMKIRAAEKRYKNGKGTGEYGTLNDLAAARLIDSSLASGTRYGYRFNIKVKENSFVATAVPLEFSLNSWKGTGSLSFYVDDSGIIRAGVRDGAEASVNDPPLAEEYQRDD